MRTQNQSFEGWEDIEELIRNGVEESFDLDFKREPYAHPKKSTEKKREDRIELRRDVAAFSNASGGTIILGIAENNLGQAAEIVSVGDPQTSEALIANVLSCDISPAFEKGELRVRVMRKPGDPTVAVIVIEVGKARPGRPRAIINEGLAEFWIREGKSKRPMTYAQIERDFHGDQEAEERRHIDAQAKSAVLQIQYRLDKASFNWLEVQPLLEDLKEYAEDFRYGATVREAVFYASCIPLDAAYADIPYDIAEVALNLIRSVLPIHSLVRKATEPLADRDLLLLRHAVYAATDLVYFATRRLHDIIVINTGAKLLHNLLRFAQVNELLELKEKILAAFEERISWADSDKVKNGGRLLRFYRDDALSRATDESVEYPSDLHWLIWHAPKKLPEDYSREE
jgi:hypothetical protein